MSCLKNGPDTPAVERGREELGRSAVGGRSRRGKTRRDFYAVKSERLAYLSTKEG